MPTTRTTPPIAAALPPLRALCAEAGVSPEAIALLDDRIDARAFMQLLMDRSVSPPEASGTVAVKEASAHETDEDDENETPSESDDSDEAEVTPVVEAPDAPDAPSLQPDVVRLLAHAMPVREAVWWAWVSARRAVGDAPPPSVAAALAAAETWIAQPTDANRRAALSRAQDDAATAPSSLVALAAGLSGGSMAPPELDEVPPPPYSASKAIAGAVIIAAVMDPAASAERYAAFVTQGFEVADRVKLWQRFAAPVRGG